VDDTVSLADDTVVLMAEGEVRQAFVRSMQKWGLRYPEVGYGGSFLRWIFSSTPAPYGSWGNGSGMRVSSVGWLYETMEETRRIACLSAEVTHNHPEGIKGAQATALAIFMARTGASKEDIRKEIQEEFGYDLSFTCDEIRPTYTWGGTCQDSVPQAIVAFLDGKDFEDCIRNAISIGGDSDTIGCITGSIAEAFYGIPDTIRKKAMSYLPKHFADIVITFEEKYKH
jgi:ADP-ribosylglycohydrolase